MCIYALLNVYCPCLSTSQVPTISETANTSKKIVNAVQETQPFLLITQAAAQAAAASALSIKPTENQQKIEIYIERCKEDNISSKNLSRLRRLLEEFYFNPNAEITLDEIDRLRYRCFVQAYIEDCDVKKLESYQINDIEYFLKKNTDIETINKLRDYFVGVNALLEKFKNKTRMLPESVQTDLQKKIRDRNSIVRIERFIKAQITQFELQQALKKVQEVPAPKKEKGLTIHEDLQFKSDEISINDSGIEIYEIVGGKFVLKERSIRSCSFR
jgi:hypothetical protein